MKPVEIVRGDGPIILALPHTGTWLPRAVHAALNERGCQLTDTDWHVERLYAGLLPRATTVRALFHRYVIDANRPVSDESLYPGQNTTGLIPMSDFDGLPIWQLLPDAVSQQQRITAFHAPYHAALCEELTRVRRRHGVAVLFDCHSIRSRIPFLFEGRLPDLNIGTADGKACDARIAAVAQRISAASGRSWVVNGRFKGGWTTRHYGNPGGGVHAIQLELAQSSYLATEAPPFAYDADKAGALRSVLAELLRALEILALEMGGRDERSRT